MSLGSVLFLIVLLCAHEAFTRHATLSISLNLSAHVSDENSAVTEEMVRICMKETQLSMAELERFKTNEILDSEADESTQCFAHCIYEHMGIMKDGIFIDNDDTRRMVMVPDTENADFAVCRSIRGSNKCDTAYKIHQCIQKVKFGQPHEQLQPLIANINRNGDSDDDSNTDNQNGQ